MEEKTQNTGTPEVRIVRIDAAWDNDRFLAEAETEVREESPNTETGAGTKAEAGSGDGRKKGRPLYAVVTDLNGERLYRVLSVSEYDALFCRTDGFRVGPQHEIVRYGSLREAREAGSPYLEAFGRLDDLADVKEKLIDYSWQPED